MKRHSKLIATLLILAVMAATFATTQLIASQAATRCVQWNKCTISRYFGQYGEEHGVDLLTHGLPINARLSGTVTYDTYLCWRGTHECIWDVTWKLDRPACHNGRCEPYAYLQLDYSTHIGVGRHIYPWTVLGRSNVFVEFGLTPDRAYGVSGWRWGIDPRFLL